MAKISKENLEVVFGKSMLQTGPSSLLPTKTNQKGQSLEKAPGLESAGIDATVGFPGARARVGCEAEQLVLSNSDRGAAGNDEQEDLDGGKILPVSVGAKGQNQQPPPAAEQVPGRLRPASGKTGSPSATDTLRSESFFSSQTRAGPMVETRSSTASVGETRIDADLPHSADHIVRNRHVCWEPNKKCLCFFTFQK